MDYAIFNQYVKQNDDRKEFLKALQKEMRRFLKENSIRFVDIPYRVKNEDSFVKKVRKSPGKFSTIYDVYDFCGLRVITYLREDIDTVRELLKTEYLLTDLENRSPDDPTKFGYNSHHGRISFKENHALQRKYPGFYAEIQIRTILQHAWAEIEHDLGYKNDYGIPDHLRRRFALLSGLLEIGDREFDELFKSVAIHKEDVARKTAGEWSKVRIDIDSLKHYCDTSEALKISANKIRTQNKLSNSAHGHDFVRAIIALDFLNIETLGELDELIEAKKDLTIAFSKKQITKINAMSQFADADFLYFLTLFEAANLGESALRQLLTKISSSGRESDDQQLVTQWMKSYSAVIPKMA